MSDIAHQRLNDINSTRTQMMNNFDNTIFQLQMLMLNREMDQSNATFNYPNREFTQAAACISNDDFIKI